MAGLSPGHLLFACNDGSDRHRIFGSFDALTSASQRD